MITRKVPEWIAAKAFEELCQTIDEWDCAVQRISLTRLTDEVEDWMRQAHDTTEVDALEWALRRVWRDG